MGVVALVFLVVGASMSRSSEMKMFPGDASGDFGLQPNNRVVVLVVVVVVCVFNVNEFNVIQSRQILLQ